MPRSGGPSSKYGQRYEDRWTAHCALRVLAGEADSIELEGRNSEIGFEFSLAVPGAPEHHQVKRQRASEGRWTLAALREEGVLGAFEEKLQSPDASCVFASAHAAHVLDELADSARAAESWALFEQRLEERLHWKGQFEELCEIWNADGLWGWEALRRVRVATLSERELAERLALEAELALEGPSENSPAALIEILRDRVDQRLEAKDLWEELEGRGLTRRTRTSGPGARAEVERLNERFRTSRRATLIAHKLIPRGEAERLEEALAEVEVVFLHGEAGSGKSDVLLEFCERLRAADTPHLALRLDRQAPAQTARQLGEELGLPGSPAMVLAESASPGTEAYLIIDQLDALSSASGRNPRFFEAVAETLGLALSRPGTKVVLACRTFDAENDSRLRRLALTGGREEPSEVKVEPLPEAVVRKTLTELGIEPGGLDPAVLELLRLPVHLSLLAGIAESGSLEAAGLRGLHDLYEAYWSAKSAEVSEVLTGASHWSEALDALVDEMSANEALAAPAAILDRWPEERQAMISAGVLVRDGARLAFFHETFFDYVFARRFIGRGGTLQQLLAKDQFLFRRAQVRQILDYSRRASPELYPSELKFLLGSETVRFHLKDLVTSWLAEVDQPRNEEWALLEPILADAEHPLHQRGWHTISSAAWFEFLDSAGHMQRWLEDPERRGRAMASLMAATGSAPERVAALLSPYIGVSAEWRAQIATLLGRSHLDARELVDLQLELIEAGELGEGDFWFATHGLEKEHPTWICELLAAYLRNRLEAATEAEVANPFDHKAGLIPANLHIDEQILAAAKGSPIAFVEHVWPVIAAMLERATEEPFGAEKRLLRDKIWIHRHFGDVYDIEDHLLVATESGFAELGRQEPERFEALLGELAQSEIETVIALAFCGLAANPERFADTAIEFLLADQRRFRVGYSDGEHWATRKLLEAVTPQASKDALERLGAFLLDYYTAWERSAAGHTQWGLAQFTLLGGIAEERRPEAVRKRFAEWQRKFDLTDGPSPFGIQGGTVGSPIAPDAAQRMSNAHWLGAIGTYRDDRFENRKDFLRGGADQLSSVLESEAERDPVRFAKLASEIPDDANKAYFEALLRGVGKSEESVPLELVAELIRRCHRLPDRPCGRWIANPLRRFTDQGLPADLIEIIGYYAIHGDGRSMVGISENPGRRERQMAGLNSVRGGVAYDLARLVASNAANVEAARPAIESLLGDPIIAVREAALEIPLAMLRHDEAQALEWFIRGITDIDDVVLDSRGVHEFLRYRALRYYERLKPVIARMIEADEPDVRRAGAAQAALAALGRPASEELLDRCLAGGVEMRLGAARVLAFNVSNARFRGLCEERLVALFDDPDEEVRKEATKAIRHLRKGGLAEVTELARSFLGSRAFAEDPEAIVFAIDGDEEPPVGLSMDAVEAVLERLSAPEDPRTRDALIAAEVNEVLMKLYTDARSESLKNRALDVLDRAIEANSYGANRELGKYDRG